MSDGAPGPRVVVLMSTYNGERYVAEQLRSILKQLPPHGRIVIRDDGSRDGTVAAVEALHDSRIQLTCGANCGFGRSFLTLLAAASADTDMVMFADQDDVWLPNKVQRAWQHLQGFKDQAALYGSAQMLVNENLQPMHPTPPWPRGPSLMNALTENIITGCTAAINRPALALLQRAGVPEGVVFHDWWLYLVISAFGRVVYDDEPTLLYRQHGNNLIGHGAGWWGRQRQMVRFLLRNDWVGILLAQVAASMKYFGTQLPPDHWRLIAAHFAIHADGHLVPRWRLIFSARQWRQRPIDELALRVLLAAYQLRLWPLPGRRLARPADPLP